MTEPLPCPWCGPLQQMRYPINGHPAWQHEDCSMFENDIVLSGDLEAWNARHASDEAREVAREILNYADNADIFHEPTRDIMRRAADLLLGKGK